MKDRKDKKKGSLSLLRPVSPMKQLLAAASEEDKPMTGKNVLQGLFFGDVIWRQLLQSNVRLVLLIVVFTVLYIGVRYQCQHDLVEINELQAQLKDAKYNAMTSSSNLTERTRESHILNALRQNRDTLLHISEQPPYIIEIED